MFVIEFWRFCIGVVFQCAKVSPCGSGERIDNIFQPLEELGGYIKLVVVAVAMPRVKWMMWGQFVVTRETA